MVDEALTPQQMETYMNLMVEIKFRIEAVNDVLGGKLRMRQRIAEEFCYLQLRLVCEVIAIACLVIHGNLKPKADLFKTYKADWIMSELNKLHPKFFPQPLTSVREYEPDGTPILNFKTSGFLTREELGQLWNRHSGAVLHRGSVKNILGKQERALNFPKVSEWGTKIVHLLEDHMIRTPNEEYLFHVILSDLSKGGNVSSTLLANIGPTPYPHKKPAP